MPRKNKFAQLTPDDRKFILDLCSKTTYDQACITLAKPRAEGGLSLQTGISSLCRFCTTYDPDAEQTMVLGQYSQSLQIRHQANAAAHTEAILLLTAIGILAYGAVILVERRVLHYLPRARFQTV